MKLIDTNILVRYLVGDGGDRAAKAFRLMRRLEHNEEKAHINALVLFETIFTLQKTYGVSRQKIRDSLIPIFSFRGLSVDMQELFEDALDMYAEHEISFADIFNVVYMRHHSIKEIYSFDRDFDKIKEIKRVTP